MPAPRPCTFFWIEHGTRMHIPHRFIIAALLLAATLAASRWSENRPPDFLAAPLETIDRHIDGWSARESPRLTEGVLNVLRPTSYLARTYAKNDRELALFIAFYAQQRAGESMHSPKACLPGSGWEIVQFDSAMVPVRGTTVTVNKYTVQQAGERMQVLYWYQSRQRVIASEYLGKLLLLRDALLEGPTAGSIVRITLRDLPDSAELGAGFAAALIPQLERCFGR
jgi:EpsI family protein